MARLTIALWACISITPVLSAQLNSQTSSSPAHQHPGLAPMQQIDGSVNPELIPDSTAYRLFFLVVGNESNSPTKPHQKAHIAGLGLGSADSKALISILSEFRSRYSALIGKYNETAEAAATKREIPDNQMFLLQRDALVEATRANIRTTLSTEGVAALDAHIKAEKHGIRMIGPVLLNK